MSAEFSFETVWSGADVHLPGHREPPPDWLHEYGEVRRRLLDRRRLKRCVCCAWPKLHRHPTGSVFSGKHWCLLCMCGRMLTWHLWADGERANRRRITEARVLGKCSACGGPRPCKRCGENASRSRVRVRDTRRALGVCIYCGVVEVPPQYAACQTCRDKKAAAERARAARKAV